MSWDTVKDAGLGFATGGLWNVGQALMPKQPTSPDYKGAAEATANASHVNATNPFGSNQWAKGADGQWSQNTTFGGPLQQALDQYQHMGPLDYGADARKSAEDAAYSQATSRLNPEWEQRGQALQSQLASQGLDPGTEAATGAQGTYDRARNDAFGSARNEAVGQGLQAQNQAFGQSLGAHQQALQSLMGLLGHAPGQAMGAANGANYLGAAGLQGNFDQASYDQLMKLLGGGLQAGGTAFAAGV